MSRPFSAGERVLLFDSKDRRYLVTLAVGGEFHTHSGPVPHDVILGQEEGVVVRSTRGARYTAVRPTLAEVVLKMPRGAQVIYPKDLGPILILADIFPGANCKHRQRAERDEVATNGVGDPQADGGGLLGCGVVDSEVNRNHAS